MPKKLKKPIAFLTVFAMLLSVLLYFPEGTFGGFGLSVRAGAATLNPSSSVATTAPSGSGSSSSPYIITTKENLYWFANEVNSGRNAICAKLENDITVNSNVLDSNGELGSGAYDLWTPIAGTGDGYRGSFDGNGKTISGIVIQNPSDDYQGFFGKVYSGTVSALNIADSYIEGHDNVGGICGYSYSGGINGTYSIQGTIIGNNKVGGICGEMVPKITLENCSVKGIVKGNENVGGLVAFMGAQKNFSSSFQDCTNEAAVSGKTNVGGIVGYLDEYKWTFTNCTNKGKITGTKNVGGITGMAIDSYPPEQCSTFQNCENTQTGSIEGTACLGGICGNTTTNFIYFSDCSNAADITAVANEAVTSEYAGGIYGGETAIISTITNCYNTGNIYGIGDCIGGILSVSCSAFKVENCYNTGDIYGGNVVGGILSWARQSNIIKCWNSGNVTATGETVGGIVGYHAGDDYHVTRNCYNTGNVTGTKYVCGIAGSKYSTNYGIVFKSDNIQYCYNIGEVTGDSDYYGVTGSTSFSVTNCYYDMDKNPGAATNSRNKGMTTSAFESGEVTYKLQGSGDGCWGQNLDDDTIAKDVRPILTGDPKRVVYLGKDEDDNDKFHNHLGDTCQYCPYIPKLPEKDNRGVFVITTSNELYGFACYVNGTQITNDKHPSASAILAADITVNESVLTDVSSGNTFNLVPWAPIGDTIYPFNGSFDGNGHTISGLYTDSGSADNIGLFGVIGSTGSVSNVGILGSYFKGNDYVGGIAGKNYGTISGCFNKNCQLLVDDANSNKGAISGSGGTVNNSCYHTTYSSDLVDSALSTTDTAFRSGEVAYFLNGDQTKLVWGQNVTTTPKDSLPTAFTEENRVYLGRKVQQYHNHIPSDVDCALCPTFYAEEITPNNGVYEITDINELYWFAQFVNSGNNNVTAVLKNDITANQGVLDENGNVNSEEFAYWTPIGNYSKPFNGSFNGNGYKISGLYLNDADADYAGLFGVIGRDGSISNVGIVDSYFSGKNAGGIAGKNDGTISACFSTGKVSGTDSSGGISGSGGTVNNCYYLSDTDSGEEKTAAQFAGGEVAYLLNNGGKVWGQNVDTDPKDAVPTAFSDEKEVFLGRISPYYHNHAYGIDYCSICPTYMPKEPNDTNDDGVYEISNRNELYWFAGLVNGTLDGVAADPGAKGVLTANITVNEDLFDENGTLVTANIKSYWTPIGNETNKFTGSFDGDGYTISGLFTDESADNIGLFGVIGEGGKVSNVGVVNSYFKGNDYVGVIAGKNDGEINGCFSTSTIEAAGANRGGISGNASDKVTNSFFLVSGVSNAVDNVLDKNNTAFTSGEVAYLLNGNQTRRVWGQTVSGENTDALPVHITENNIVYLGVDGVYHNHTSAGGDCQHCKHPVPVKPQKVNGEYRITNANELYGFAAIVNGGFEAAAEPDAKGVLTANIIVNADLFADDGSLSNGEHYTWTTIGTSSIPFTGSFDGNGYTISGLYFNDAASNIGLIGYAGNGAQISEVCVSNSYFSGEEYIGAVCGYNNGGSISECCSTGNQISGKYAGGISGYNSGTVKDCCNTGAVSGIQAAGIVSQNDGSGNVQYCINIGSISGTDCNPACASTGNVTNCFYNEDFSSCTGGAGTAVSTYTLTSDSFLTANGFDASIWEKNPNDEDYLYYPSLKNIIADGTKVGYTARFVLENTTSAPIVYSKDMSFTFDAVLDLEGKSNPVSVTSQISPLELAQMDFAIEHNGIPLDAVISYTVDFASGRLTILIDGRDAGSIAFDNESKKIIVIITEDLNAGENTVNLTYNGTSVPLFTGVKGSCTVTIERAVPVIELPEATGLNYGQLLSDSVLSDTDWSWVDGTVIPTVTNSGYNAVTSVDDENYVYDNIEGYNSAAHTLTKAIPVTVTAAVPTIVVSAATKSIPGSTVTLSAVVTNPNNSTLTDLPAVSGYTYKIGDGAEQTITNSSFVIPENIPNNSSITITAKTSATDNYAVGTGTVTVLVTDCTHQTITLMHDANKHWYHCSYCGADIDVSVHSGGTATCTSKAVCEVCGQEYGTVDSNNHTGVSSVWNYDATGHWHICSACNAQVDKAAHISSGQATADKAEICTVCQYEITPKLGQVATPLISPNGGSFTGSQQITITCRTDGAAIYYTLDGTVPTSNSTRYTGAFTLTESATVKAIAIKIGMSNSSVSQAVYTITADPVDPVIETVAAPVITPNGGSFTGSQQITITCQTNGAEIYYTLDGTVPTANSTRYTGAFTLTESATVRAIAIKAGMNNSTVSQAVYTITAAPVVETVAAPVITPNGGSFTGSQQITITCQTNGAEIYYTLDGTVPTANSTKYTGAFTLTESATVKAIAIKAGMNNSTVSQAVYTITAAPVVETVAAPVITPNGGSFTGTKQVTITCATDGAVIYYTTDGTTPTTSGTRYTGAFTISSTTTIKAIAVKSGMENSDIVSVTFTKSSSGGSGGGGSSHRPSSTSYPIYNGRQMTWEEIAAELMKMEKGAEATIQLNGNTEVPVVVVKAIDDRDLKVTFVVDSVRSWKTDGAEITAPAAADLTFVKTASLNYSGLRGIVGIQFTINNTNIPTDIEIAFKAEHAGKFANLYKNVDGKPVFVTCTKLGADGKVILHDVVEKGDYIVMLCEFSDLLGDMSNDGVLNAQDAAAILKDIVGLESGRNPLMADFNCDGKINALDASAILKRIVGLA